jgi:hypothetical protein
MTYYVLLLSLCLRLSLFYSPFIRIVVSVAPLIIWGDYCARESISCHQIDRIFFGIGILRASHLQYPISFSSVIFRYYHVINNQPTLASTMAKPTKNPVEVGKYVLEMFHYFWRCFLPSTHPICMNKLRSRMGRFLCKADLLIWTA